MDTKVACLLLIILGALTVQGAVSGNKRMNLHARQWGGIERECMNNGEEQCFPMGQCPGGFRECSEYYCGSPSLGCCCWDEW
uniref:Small cysteine-rich protein 4 n=1 Tax=Orbicella faveolata TaxID=48498 RepID=SCR4B_ORBFA|nr:RecName: Full=Small cysteine-rich protein 4; Short=Mfav-SCRiP8; Short=SCRiP4; Flags: Precursor [Orbicella faveolata]ACO24834.1 small cysteine-rich protein 4 [Orbicella faveolata]